MNRLKRNKGMFLALLLVGSLGLNADDYWVEQRTRLEAMANESPGVALELAESLLGNEGVAGYPDRELVLLLRIARLEHAVKGSRAAIITLEKAEMIARTIGELELLGETLDLLVLNYSRNGDLDKARALVDEAFEVRARLPEPRNEGHSYYAKTIMHWFEGNYAEALASGMEGVRLFRSGDCDSRTGAHLYNALGITSHYLGEYDRSIDYYRESMALHRENGNRIAEAALLSNMGEAMARKGDLEGALAYHRRSYSLENELGNIRGVAYTLNVMAETIGGMGRYRDMLDYAKQALVLHGNLENPWGEAYSHRLIGEAEGKLDNWSNARSHLEKAIEIGETIQAREHLKEAHRVMSDILEKLDDSRAAMHHFRQFKMVSDEILNRETQERIKELEVRYETETTREHLAHVQKESRLQSAQLKAERLIRGLLVAGVMLLLVLLGVIILLYWMKQRANAEMRKGRDELARLNSSLERIVDERTRELRLVNESLELAKTRAEEADRLKSEFLMLMSHEYRTPLNIILGFAGMLHRQADAPSRPMTQAILSSGEKLNDLLTRILDFVEFDEPGQKPLFDNLLLREMVDGICVCYRERAREKGLSFQLTYGEDTPARLCSDRRRLGIILRELLDNAVKFTDRGSVQLTLSCEDGVDGGKHLRFEVSDTGIGISDEVRKRLFVPFVLGDASLNRMREGVGIGLVMAKRIVDHLFGSISFESVPGSGTVFSVTFPMKADRGCVENPGGVEESRVKG